MEELLQKYLRMSADEAGLILAILLPLLGLLSRRVREILLAAGEHASLTTGRVRARYRRWFLREHGTLKNIVLKRVEELSLDDTYVSLSVQSMAAGADVRMDATAVLAPFGPRRVFLVGDPGSGKSTLLKAYGSGILRSRRRHREASRDMKALARTNEFPILVALRHVAGHIEAGGTFESYILDLLRSRAGVKRPEKFLRRLLLQGRIVLLLDGLDEISKASYERVRAAIYDFATRPEASRLPTSMARIVISCRRQNYLQFREDWTWFSDRHFLVSPLDEPSISRFVQKRQRDFPENRSPHTFLADVRASGTLDLHRVPLLLAISVGLYISLPGYEIPRSVGQLYSEMLTELLRRHDFPVEGQLRMNRFPTDDKLRFLRDFAIHLTNTRSASFADFSYNDIVDYCLKRQPTITRLRRDQAENFVDEIIDRSGILTSTSDEGHFAYAHRSLHEYFVASRLALDPSKGSSFLYTKADDPEWRQVTIFFCSPDNPQSGPFLTKLGVLNPELACACLATAMVPEEVATALVKSVQVELSASDLARERVLPLLSALIQATHSRTEAARESAFEVLGTELQRIARLKDAEFQRQIFSGIFGGESPIAAKLIQSMAQTSAIDFPETIVQLSLVIPDDNPALVAPLWHSLSVPTIGHTKIAREIVQRLIVLAMSRACFNELQLQPGLNLRWVPDSHRRAAYPLRNGLPLTSNLVTLLGCAYTLKAFDGLPKTNLYIQALSAPGQPLRFLEQHTSWWRKIRPFRAVRAFAYSSLCCFGFAALWVLYDYGRPTGGQEPPTDLPEALLGVHVATTLIVSLVTSAATRTYERHSFYGKFSKSAYLIPATVGPAAAFFLPLRLGLNVRVLRSRSSGVIGDLLRLPIFLVIGILYLPLTIMYVLPFTRILPASTAAAAVAGGIYALATYWLPSTELLGRYTIYSSKGLGRYTQIYSDLLSRHWVLPGKVSDRKVPAPRLTSRSPASSVRHRGRRRLGR
ncbi:NACHT domain-containing protein [Micromonospora soli]|uniref:NACHT domain-containing protein n=1 Tax=Micromonospora sp. NBRC 110009 TaxID=3061627 RepID=UPI002673A07E|nr:NACHT domain-containing protein [Micromonospora sp. NBRC 110009]WKT97232.1 NACHT domain-containing protein [Micromonospora sp. NBRC 110009]